MPATLAVSHLTFRYRRDEPTIIDDLTYKFSGATLTAVGGASGRGKSTLLFLLGLLLTPTAGGVLLDGVDVARGDDRHRAQLRASRIGFMFQDAQLDPARSIIDNVVEPSLYAGFRVGERAARGLELLDRFGVGHRASHRPGQISGGQAQRVALCRALVNEPGVILADEPTGNLDRENAELVLTALQQSAAEGCTVLIATHDPFVREFCGETLTL